MTDYPIVRIPGSENWQRGYELADELEKAFPHEECENFAHAISENWDSCPDLTAGITKLICLEQGLNDETDWIWYVVLGKDDVGYGADRNAKRYVVRGWCDYTGWDCRSAVTWTEILPCD